LYSRAIKSLFEKTPHKTILEAHGLQEALTLGGGFIGIRKDIIYFLGQSAAYGSVPNSVARKFGELIVEHLRQRGRIVSQVESDMAPITMARDKKSWIDLGLFD